MNDHHLFPIDNFELRSKLIELYTEMIGLAKSQGIIYDSTPFDDIIKIERDQMVTMTDINAVFNDSVEYIDTDMIVTVTSKPEHLRLTVSKSRTGRSSQMCELAPYVVMNQPLPEILRQDLKTFYNNTNVKDYHEPKYV